jgi:hypothetical protein
LGRDLARNGKAALFGLVEVLTGYQHVLKGRIEGMQVSSMNGRVVSRCTHADGSYVISIQTPNAVAGIAIVIMTKKAGPSAGSAKG